MTDNAQAIILAGAAFGAIAYFTRLAWRAFKVVDAIHKLIAPNGGSSIGDRVKRIDEQFAAHLIHAAEQDARLAEIRRHLGFTA